MSAPDPKDHMDVECPECRGEGEVSFNNSRNHDPQCDDVARCPTCHGDGVVKPGTPIYDPADRY